jgi:hypothetical protein
MIDQQIDIALRHVAKHAMEAKKYKDAFHEMCSYYYSLMEGDTHRIGDASKLMREFGIIDEDGEMIYEEDE